MKVRSEPGKGYVGCYDLLMMGHVKECRTLGGERNLKELVEDTMDYNEPKYHIIRLARSCENVERKMMNMALKLKLKLKTKHYTMETKLNLDALLAMPPKIHTVIFIKERMPIAKTLEHGVHRRLVRAD